MYLINHARAAFGKGCRDQFIRRSAERCRSSKDFDPLSCSIKERSAFGLLIIAPSKCLTAQLRIRKEIQRHRRRAQFGRKDQSELEGLRQRSRFFNAHSGKPDYNDQINSAPSDRSTVLLPAPFADQHMETILVCGLKFSRFFNIWCVGSMLIKSEKNQTRRRLLQGLSSAPRRLSKRKPPQVSSIITGEIDYNSVRHLCIQ